MKIPELQVLRQTVKANQSKVMKRIRNEYYNLNGGRKPFCMFCGTTNELTKEHVIPRWAFDKCPDRDFITSINNSRTTYNRTTIPTCANCNGVLLNTLERADIQSLSHKLKHSFFNNDELQNIIRWLEIIDYKFQVTGFIRKFIKSRNIPYSDYLSNIPIALYRLDLDNNRKIFAELRHTLKRIGVKSKGKFINSLVIFKTKNTGFHFFHSYNKFIFFELPKFYIAMLYFYDKIFQTNKEAYDEAMQLIKKVY